MGSIEPSPDRIQQLRADADDETPVVMINLLRYRERAAYADDAGVETCSGREAYRRYGEVALQRVSEVGGRPIWAGAVGLTLIAPEGERWDDAVLVQYPSRKAFLQMVSSPDYQACVFHRTAALEDSRLIATTTQTDLLGEA